MGNVLTSYFAENCYQRGLEEGDEQRRRAALEPLHDRAIALASDKADKLSPYDKELVRELRDEGLLVALLRDLEHASGAPEALALIVQAFERDQRRDDQTPASGDCHDPGSRSHEHSRRCSELGLLYGAQFAAGFLDGLAGDSRATPDPPTARAIIHHIQRRLDTLGRRPWRIPEAEGLIALLDVVRAVVEGPAITRRFEPAPHTHDG